MGAMKLLCLLVAFCLFTGGALEGAAITASELAQHLGVSVWRISEAKLPKHFMVYFASVENGKLGPNSSGTGLQRDGDLVICAHEENGKMMITAACGGSMTTPYINGLEIAPFPIQHEIGNQAALGPHLLFADYKLQSDAKNPNGLKVATGKIEDATRGLVLVVATD